MPFPAFVACIAAMFVCGLFISAGLLWLAAKICRASDARFRRLLGAVVAAGIVGFLVQAAAVWVGSHIKPSSVDDGLERERAVVYLAGLAMSIAAQWAIVKRATQTKTGRSIAVFTIWLIAWMAISLSSAFAIRATVFEAFVVPAGSMAPTVIGDHAAAICPACSFAHVIGLSSHSTGNSRDDGGGPQLGITCPNCLTPHQLPADVKSARGDRLLVDKTITPQRWDLAAFEHEESSTIYLKRLIGLPGERLEIAGGEIMIDGVVLRKPHDQPDLLWLPVHDSRYALNDDHHGSPWELAGDAPGWSQMPDNGWQFRSQGPEWQSIEFSRPITDESYYFPRDPFFDEPESFEYGDARIDCHVSAFTGSGAIRLTWGFREDIAALELSSADDAVLLVNGGRKWTGAVKFRPPEFGVVSLAVRDGEVIVLEDGAIVTTVELGQSGGTTTSPGDQPADISESGPPICRLTIEARNCEAAISRIVVQRDVYYRTSREVGNWLRQDDGPVALQEDESYFLGDHSAHSNDSRFSGPVRQTLFVGVARCTYWPPTRWKRFR